MKKILYIFLCILILWSCEENTPPAANKTVINTGDASNITTNSATLSISVNEVGAAKNIGVIWGADDILISNIQTTNVNLSKGEQQINISVSSPGTYFYKAFAVDKFENYVYGDTKSFLVKEEKRLLISTSSIVADALTKTYTVDINSNTSWNVSSNQTWCKIDPVSGTNNGILNIIVDDNIAHLGRSTIITISSGALSEQILIMQNNFPYFEMVTIPSGTFTMGSPIEEVGRDTDEIQHQVTVSSFQIGKYEVTQQLWTAVMGSNPSAFKSGNNYPVETVGLNDIELFFTKLKQLTGKTYRLPTEAEWEYAYRAETTTPFYSGYDLTTSQANYNGNYPYNGSEKGQNLGRAVPVGSYPPNAWGIYDMSGNIYELCSDWYDSYSTLSQTDPKGPTKATGINIQRGGCWACTARGCRAADRLPCYYGSSSGDNASGFRVVLSLQ